jgi:hypothetical protein
MIRLTILIFASAAMMSGVGTVAGAAQRNPGDNVVFVAPIRRPPDALPAAPPSLPPGADDIPTLTFEVLVEHKPLKGRALVQRQTVSRTKDRIHILADGKEWLFERNPVDPRRVSASLIHHPSRTVVLHEESDLRNTLGINGWADVVMIGFDATSLNRLTPTAESRTMEGIRFRRHVSASERAGVSEVWWNQDYLLPATFVVRQSTGVTKVFIQRLDTKTDPVVLQSPSSRLPDYRVVNLAEWLEGH